jgi:hypothetical protein
MQVVESQAELDPTHCDSREKVLNTIEILEGILECLPAKTLLVVQRVNKRFHETIAESPRIKRKMFLRIENDHSILWEAHYTNESGWRFKQVNTNVRHPRIWVTPVVLNPFLEHFRPPNPAIVALLEGGEQLRVSCQHTFPFEQFEHQSIGKEFFCDPQSTTIRAILSFALGSAGIITVHATVHSYAPLTIGTTVTRALDTRGRIIIEKRRGHSQSLKSGMKEGVPRTLIGDLKGQTGLEVFFNPPRSTFQVIGVVVPTNEDSMAANSNGPEG